MANRSLLAIILVVVVVGAVVLHEQGINPLDFIGPNIMDETTTSITIRLVPAKGQYYPSDKVTVTGTLSCSGICPMTLVPYAAMPVDLSSSWGWSSRVTTDASGTYSQELTLPNTPRPSSWLKAVFNGVPTKAKLSAASINFQIQQTSDYGVLSTTGITVRLMPAKVAYSPSETVTVTGTLLCSGSCPMALLPYSGMSVQISSSWGWSSNAITDTSGSYSAPVQLPAGAGSYSIKAQFTGAGNVQGSSASTSFVVKASISSTNVRTSSTTSTRVSTTMSAPTTIATLRPLPVETETARSPTRMTILSAPQSIKINEQVTVSMKLETANSGTPIQAAKVYVTITNTGENDIKSCLEDPFQALTGGAGLCNKMITNTGEGLTGSNGVSKISLSSPQLGVGDAEISALFLGDNAYAASEQVVKVPVIASNIRLPTVLTVSVTANQHVVLLVKSSDETQREERIETDKIDVRAFLHTQRDLLTLVATDICYTINDGEKTCFSTPYPGGAVVPLTTVGKLKFTFSTDLGSASDQYKSSTVTFHLDVSPPAVSHATTSASLSACPQIQFMPFHWSHKNIKVLVTYDAELTASASLFTRTVESATQRWSSTMSSFGQKYSMPEIVGFTFTVSSYETSPDISITFTKQVCQSFGCSYVAGIAAVDGGSVSSGISSYSIKIKAGGFPARAKELGVSEERLLNDVVTHELGHALGLGHVASCESNHELMNPAILGEMRITTLDLYGLGMFYKTGQATAVSLPEDIPYADYEVT